MLIEEKVDCVLGQLERQGPEKVDVIGQYLVV